MPPPLKGGPHTRRPTLHSTFTLNSARPNPNVSLSCASSDFTTAAAAAAATLAFLAKDDFAPRSHARSLGLLLLLLRMFVLSAVRARPLR